MAGLSSATRIRTTEISPIQPRITATFATHSGEYRCHGRPNNTPDTLQHKKVADFAIRFSLVSLTVTLGFVLLENCSGSDFFGSIAITAGPLGALLNVLVFPLFLWVHTAQM